MTAGAFDSRDAGDAAPGFAHGTEPNAFLREMAWRIPPGRVLFLARLGHEVVGLRPKDQEPVRAEARS